MRYRGRTLIVLACLLAIAPCALATTTVSLEWDLQDLSLVPEPDGTLAVGLAGGIPASEPGEPDLPWIVVSVPLEPGTAVRAAEWVAGPAVPLGIGLRPRAPMWPHPDDPSGTRRDPDPGIYDAGSAPWPSQALVELGVQRSEGRTMAAFRVCPFTWDPARGALSFSPRGELQVTLGTDGASRALTPLRPAPARPAEVRGGTGSSLLYAFQGRLPADSRPGLDSPPVEMVLVTADSLVTNFQPLVDWKNRAGHPTTIRTVEWIDANYPHGVDQAERVRLFLKEAWAMWGTRAAILGGDPRIVPIRYVHSNFYKGDEGGLDLQTDFYYSCLDGSWNADGDQIWGESVSHYHAGTDSVDLRPELRVGRVSAASRGQVNTWVQKYLKYVRDPDVASEYLKKFLLLGEVIDPGNYTPSVPDHQVSNDGASYCFRVIDSLATSPLGSFFQYDQLYERSTYWNERRPTNSRLLNRPNTVASINQGRNIIFHMGHGDRDRWAIGLDRLLNADMIGTTNSSRPAGLAYVVNCNSAAVDADCMGEAFQFAPGGGLNYIGSSSLHFPSSSAWLQDYFWTLWATSEHQTPGSAWFAVTDSLAKRQSISDGVWRFLLYGLLYLGDPDMTVWTTNPAAMQVTVNPSDLRFPLGGAPVRVIVRDGGGNFLAQARVCLHKEGDATAVMLTDATGMVDLPFPAATTGACKLTVTHPRARPYEANGTVVAPAPSFASLDGYDVVDDGTLGTAGNGNGQIETGETVALTLHYTNRGGAEATGLSVRLDPAAAVPGFEVTMEDDEESLPSLAAGGSGAAPAAFRFRVTVVSPVPVQTPYTVVVPFTLTWEAADGTHEQTLRPTFERPDILLVRTQVRELTTTGTPDSLPTNGETIGLVMELNNRGGGTWSSLRGRIVPSIPASVTMLDSLARVPTMGPFELVRTDTMKFTVRVANDLRVNFILEDTLGGTPQTVWSRLLRLRVRPMAPESLWTSGRPSSLKLWWKKPVNTSPIWGYRVYRAAQEAGPYVPIGPGFVERLRTQEDAGLSEMTRYWYQVAAIDSSGIMGPPSPATVASTSPGTLSGWPVSLTLARDACPVVDNLNGWGANEILAYSDYLYSFNDIGGDYFDGDNVPSTRGPLVPPEQAKNLYGKAAVADILRDATDNTAELIVVATNGEAPNWTPPAKLLVLDYLGQERWSQTLLGRPIQSAPAVGNIDDDPELEIVFLAGKYLYAFNHDGTPVEGKEGGRLLTIPGAELGKIDYQYASVGLANIDGSTDPWDEIVFTTHASTADAQFCKLYAINAVEVLEGLPRQVATNVPNFPYSYQTHGGVSQQNGHSSVALGDVTGDNSPEIFVITRTHVWCLDPQKSGTNKLHWKREMELTAIPVHELPLTPSPALGDIDLDGDLDVVVPSGSGRLYVLDGGTGSPLPGFFIDASKPYITIAPENARLGSPILANLDGQAGPEIIIGDSNGTVYAFLGHGAPMGGFPFSMPGGKVGIGLAAWDVDRDGFQNLVIQADKVQEIRILSFPDCPIDPNDLEAMRRDNPWPVFRHDNYNTGYIEGSYPTPVETLLLEGAAADGSEVVLRWRTPLPVAEFLVRRMAEPDGSWEEIGRWPADEIREAPERYRVTDRVPAAGEWSYRVEAIDLAGEVTLAGETSLQAGAAPLVFRLHPARPNPLRGETALRLDLPVTADCDLRVVDVSGRTVRRLLRGLAGPGSIEQEWDGLDDEGRPVGSGIYFARASASGQGQQTQRLILLK